MLKNALNITTGYQRFAYLANWQLFEAALNEVNLTRGQWQEGAAVQAVLAAESHDGANASYMTFTCE